MTTKENLEVLYDVQKKAKMYMHAAGVLQYDKETICPRAAMKEQGEIVSELYNIAFTMFKDDKFVDAANKLYEHLDELDEFDRSAVICLHDQYLRIKNITPEKNLEYSNIYNDGFVAWLEGKEKADFSIFAPKLEKIVDITYEQRELCEKKYEDVYDFVFDNYEKGVTSKDLDECFGYFKERAIPLLNRIKNSNKKIRTDFLSRPVSDDAQRKLAEKLMDILGMDKDRRALTTSEHPFTDSYSYNDVRITTHYYPTAFISSMYSVIHEGGHALFEQFQAKENFDHYLNKKTMGMHESVSRFYENIIGRSKGFVHLIYPVLQEVFPDVMADVTEKELYEALNVVEPSLIRTEADEFTYTFHVIIRYEIERMILEGKAKVSDIPQIWSDKYYEYLGIRPQNDKEGALQDMHWSDGFGYFPTYALGNMYNSMYFNTMKKDMDVEKEVEEGHMDKILDWMKEHVFARADRMDPKPWIKEITGRDFTAKDFLDYLEEKYSAIYEL